MKKIYLDNNATTPLDPAVLEAMLPYLREDFGNPSSIHQFGRKIKVAIEEAREKVANLIGAEPLEIIFTSCGSESDNMAIKGVASYLSKKKGNHIITSQIEHPAVLETCQFLEKNGYEVTYVSVDKYGTVDLQEIEDAVKESTILITIMHGNNEIGTVQPLKDIGEIAKKHGIYFHTDAVQSAGKIPTKVDELGVDLLSLAGHKLHGPKGVGALYVKKRTRMHYLINGGHQERGRRAGTENVAGIVGLGAACEIAGKEMESEAKRLTVIRDALYKGIMERIPDVQLNGHPTNRLPTTLNMSFKYVEGESLLINLDLKGVAISTGSACSSGSLEPSHVLLALKIPHEIIHGSLRFSFGRFNKPEEVDYVLEVLPPIVEKMRDMSPLWDKKKVSLGE